MSTSGLYGILTLAILLCSFLSSSGMGMILCGFLDNLLSRWGRVPCVIAYSSECAQCSYFYCAGLQRL
jgi:hypothetical protein